MKIRTLAVSTNILALSLAVAAGSAFAEGNLQFSQATPPPTERTSQGEARNERPAGQTTQPAQSGQSAQSAQSGQKGSAGHPVVYMLVPVTVADRDPAMKEGCWAKFHDDQNFRGDTLTLVGPVDMPDMTGPFGIDWKDKISSVETGAKATVQVYDNENFTDLVSTFKPGQKVEDVSKKMGFFDEFASLKISCTK